MGRATTAHGFRSAFRDWAAERTNFAREVAEMALARVIKDKAEAACRRGDLLDKRRALMDAWSAYVASARPGKVVQISSTTAFHAGSSSGRSRAVRTVR
jgi:hypothetical protein